MVVVVEGKQKKCGGGGKKEKCGGGGIKFHYLRSSVKKKVEYRVDVGSM